MRFARPELALLAALMLMSPALAAQASAPLPPLELSASSPLIDVEIAGQRLRLTVDIGGDDVVQINPGSSAHAMLAGAERPDGRPVSRGNYHVAVGQTSRSIPFVRDVLLIAGRPIKARVLMPDTAPPGQPPGSDGTIGLPLLPHSSLTLRWRPDTDGDHSVTLPARIGRSDAYGFDWALAGDAVLDVELHPLRPNSVASAAAASILAEAGAGRLDGPVQRVLIAYGVARPVRALVLERPVKIAGLVLATADVRLFDWAGRADLPPDANPDTALTVIGRRARQPGWAVLKLGQDMLARCASINWQRQPDRLQLTCLAS
ncbi:hypothetical protein [Sandarakinorhabdus sp.]|uniref:hypothetical protein n=1 Tax=Sandarakinorhabdus sp. TaxID=1916663 RepID=UPI003F70716C